MKSGWGITGDSDRVRLVIQGILTVTDDTGDCDRVRLVIQGILTV